jgi:hypothetical protein
VTDRRKPDMRSAFGSKRKRKRIPPKPPAQPLWADPAEYDALCELREKLLEQERRS